MKLITDWAELKPYLTDLMALDEECFPDSRWTERQWEGILEYRISGLVLSPDEFSPRAFIVFSHVAGEAELLKVGVSPEVRGRGIGRTLINRMVDYLRGENVEQIFLEVREDNFSAIQLYEKLGFELSGRRKDYYDKPVADALNYIKIVW